MFTPTHDDLMTLQALIGTMSEHRDVIAAEDPDSYDDVMGEARDLLRRMRADVYRDEPAECVATTATEDDIPF